MIIIMTEKIVIVQLFSQFSHNQRYRIKDFSQIGRSDVHHRKQDMYSCFRLLNIACLCNPPLLYLYSNKIIYRYSLLRLCNFSIYHNVTTEGSKKKKKHFNLFAFKYLGSVLDGWFDRMVLTNEHIHSKKLSCVTNHFLGLLIFLYLRVLLFTVRFR